MKYALGNMLNGAGGLNADKLALDLQFAADKTLTARKGPTPTFTRASTGTFVGSNGLIQSAGNNVARFDHDPVTLESRGLLIEESRTNLLLRSELLSNPTSWSNYQIAGSATSAPDGNNTATLFTETTVNDSHVSQGAFGNNRPTPGAVACTFSIFLKAGTRRYVLVSAAAGANGVGMMVDTQTWTVTDAKSFGTGWAYTSSSLINYGNGWYRAVITFTPPAATLVTCGIAGSNTTTVSTNFPTYLGNGSTFIAWGAQLEAGSFATSYIPTTTASVVRSADVCSISGAAFSDMWNASEGTMLVNSFTPASGDRTVVSADDNTSNEMIRLRTEGTNPFFKVTDGGSELVAIDSGTVVGNTAFKLAGAYKLNNFASSINGGVAVTDTTGTVPIVDRMRIGAGQGGNTMCGCVSSMRYYKKRLSDSKLQAITA